MAENEEELAATARGRVGHSVCGGRYVIEHVLGIGGMAAVYAGVHRNGRHVALKFLHPEFSRRADIRKRFIREGQAANAVQHPGVVAVIDDDVAEDGSAFLVMERLEGKSLEQLWEDVGRRLPVRAVLAIGRDLCQVLSVAHRAGIYHRDLKPENLFLTNDGALKVLDFGLAHLRDATRPKDTHTGMVFGTPAFMPPEQASGQTSKIDARTDIWAVGATLFTLLSGELVHKGETAQHFVMLAAMEPARSLAAAMPHAHPVLVEIVDRALAREKESRWQSAEAMHESILAGMDLILGDHDILLPTPMELTRKGDLTPSRDSARGPSTDAVVTRPASPARGFEQISDSEETLSDQTRVDARPDVPMDPGLDTAPAVMKPRSEGASDTPTEQTTPDELPTRLRALDDPITLPRSSARIAAAIDPSKRASWSDLRRAIGDGNEHGGEEAEDREQTQLLVSYPSSDRTQLLGRDLRPSHSGIRKPAASGPAFATAQERVGYPAPAPVAHRRSRHAATHRHRSPGRYVPVVAAAALLGLSPLAYFIARNWNVSPPSGAPAFSAPPPVTRVPAPIASNARPSGPEPAAPPVPPVDREPAPSSAVTPSTVTPSSRAREPKPPTIVPAVAPAGMRCTDPLRLDPDGIKRWRPECLP